MDVIKKHSVAALALASFVAQFAIVIYNFTLVFYLREKEFDSIGIGIASSIYPFMYFCFCLLLPHCWKSLGKKERILFSQLGMGLTGLFLIFTNNPLLIYLTLAFYGFSMSMLWTNMETWISEGAYGKELSGRLSLFNLSWSLGSGTATTVAGYIVEKSSPNTSILFGSILFFLTFLLVAFTDKGRGTIEIHSEENSVQDSVSPWRFISWTGVFLVYAGYSLFITVMPQYAMDFLSFTESQTGNLLLARGLAVCLSFLILSKFTAWQKSKAAIYLSQAAFAVLIVVLMFLHTMGQFTFIFILLGMTFALSYDLSIYHSAQGEEGRHLRMTIHEALLTAGTMGGSLLGGFVYQYYSFAVLVIAIAVVTVTALLFEILFSRKNA